LQTDKGKDYFNKIAVEYDTRCVKSPAFCERFRIWTRFIERIAPLAKQAICIDLGCGEGTLSRVAAQNQIKVFGIDQSEEMLEIARRGANAENLEEFTEYIQATLPLGKELEDKFNAQISLILCSSVLEYIQDYEAVIRQIDVLLKARGRLIISVPNRDSVYRKMERFAKWTGLFKTSYIEHQHHQWDEDSFRNIFKEMNYAVLNEAYYALPLQKYIEPMAGNYRGKWLATMYMVEVQKP